MGAAIVMLHESLPELLLFMCSFGYLVILIFCKWSTNWNSAGPGRVDWPRGPPQIINTLIDFAMAKPVLHQNVLLFAGTCEYGPSGTCAGQTWLQRLLLLICVVCVPWLLLGKPYALKAEHDGEGRLVTQHGATYHQLEEDTDTMLEAE